jgi:hypothetical protein
MTTQALLLIVFVWVSLLAGACAAPQTAVPATQTPAATVQNTVPAPTLTSIPIPETVVPGAVDSGVTIRMSAGDKCTMEGPKSIPAGYNIIHWIAESKEHDLFRLTYVTLDPGKTVEDLRALPPENTDPPSFAHWDGNFGELAPGGSTTFVVRAVTDPLYFVCFYREPPRHFGSVGPLEVITK